MSTPEGTTIAIRGDEFYINDRPTYEESYYQGMKVQGLLMNARLVQGVFDDLNPDTVSNWAYPDTGKWDPVRNTREFLQAMPSWRAAGLLSFTINIQGGNPRGYSPNQPWVNPGFYPDGSLRPDYTDRLARILGRADELGMVPILGVYYFGQDQVLEDEEAIRRGLRGAVRWVLGRGHKNVLIEVANECDNKKYTHDIFRPGRVDELIRLARQVGEEAGARPQRIRLLGLLRSWREQLLRRLSEPTGELGYQYATQEGILRLAAPGDRC